MISAVSLVMERQVIFIDENLETAVREAINKSGGPIYQRDLRRITRLNVGGRGIERLDGLEYMSDLIYLDLSDNQVSDLTPLGHLIGLKELSLRNNGITDLSAINFAVLLDLPNLTSLSLRHNVVWNNGSHTRLSDISMLSKLKMLEELELRDNQIEDISPLRGLVSLQVLDLRENRIKEIYSLSELVNLIELNLRDNDVEDISPIAKLKKLTYLNVHSNNKIKTITPLVSLSNLQTLIIRNVPVADEVNVLSKLSNLDRLNARNCAITDTSFLNQLLADRTKWRNINESNISSIDLRDNPLNKASLDYYLLQSKLWSGIGDRSPYTLPWPESSLDQPVFSRKGGLYEDSFFLEISSKDSDAVLYYTLDGSEPTEDSLVYRSPLSIQSREGEPNILSSIPSSHSQTIPDQEVFKATVVRARAFRDGDFPSSVTTHTYFVDKNINNRFSLPVLSIVTDPRYFFDFNFGIYIPGAYWEETEPERTGNYFERGPQWERPAFLQWYEPNGASGFSQHADIRIHGSATRVYRQKSLRITASAFSDTGDMFEHELFPGLRKVDPVENAAEFKSFLLRNSGNDWASTMLRDAFMQSLVSHLSLDTQAYQPVTVFINGEYWGIHNLRERVDDYYFALKYNAEISDVVVLKYAVLVDEQGKPNNSLNIDAGEPGDELPFLELISFIENHHLTEQENFDFLKTQIDLENYIEYMVSEIYFGNTDWPHNNVKLWKIKSDYNDLDSPYGYDGRWRWVLYDTDFGFGRYSDLKYSNGDQRDYTHNTLRWASAELDGRHNILTWPNLLFRSLLENKVFTEQFIITFADHLNTTFHPQRVTQILDEMYALIEPEMQHHVSRWRPFSLDQWDDNISVMRDFALNRPYHVRNQLAEYFGLSGLAEITVVSDSSRGTVTINSITIGGDNPGVDNTDSWTGLFFMDLPVTFTAAPKPGYRFVEWQGIDASEESVSVALNGNLQVKAVFVKDQV